MRAGSDHLIKVEALVYADIVSESQVGPKLDVQGPWRSYGVDLRFEIPGHEISFLRVFMKGPGEIAGKKEDLVVGLLIYGLSIAYKSAPGLEPLSRLCVG